MFRRTGREVRASNATMDRMSSRMTRRDFAALAGAAPLAAQVVSQTPQPAAPVSPEQDLQQALEDVRKTSRRLQGIEVPMELEPAFSFRATRS